MTAWTFHPAGTFPPLYVLQALGQACTPARRAGTVAGRKTEGLLLVGHDEVVDVPIPAWVDADRLPADLRSDIPANAIPAVSRPRRTPAPKAPGRYCLAVCYCRECPHYKPIPDHRPRQTRAERTPA